MGAGNTSDKGHARRPDPEGRVQLFLIAALALLTVLFSLPVLRNPRELTFPNYTRDNYFYFWTLWWTKQALLAGKSLFHTNLLYFPYGTSLAFTETAPLPALLSLPVLAASDSPGVLVLTLNAWTMLSFVFLGWATWLFARSETGSRRGAVFAGLMLPFSAFRFHHLEHINLLAAGWLPLTAWVAGRWCLQSGRGVGQGGGAPAGPASGAGPRFGAPRPDGSAPAGPAGQPSPVWLVALGLCGLGLAMTSYTLLAFASFLLAGWLGFTALLSRRRLLPRAPWRLASAAAVFAAGTLPMTRHWIAALSAGDAPLKTLRETARWGPDLLGFLLPTRSLFLGGPARSLGIHTHGPGGNEVYLGIVFLVLVLLGIRAAGRRGLPLALTALAAFLLALGPVLWLGGRALPLPVSPYGLLMQLVPALMAGRTPERFLVIVAAALGPIIALGFDRITSAGGRGSAGVGANGGGAARGAGVNRGRLVAAIVALVAFVELCPALGPAERAVVPPVYRRLRDDPVPGAVLELAKRGDSILLAVFHQTVHGRPVVGGCLSRPSTGARSLARELDVYRRLSDPDSRKSAMADLANAGVRYLVLNREGAGAGDWRFTVDAVGRLAEPVDVGDEAAVFRLPAGGKACSGVP